MNLKTTDPRDFLKQLADLNEVQNRSFQQLQQGPGLAPPAPAVGANFNQIHQILIANLQYQAQVGELLREQVLAADILTRDNKALSNKIEELEATLEEDKKAMDALKADLVTADKMRVEGLNEAGTQYATEKKELEGTVSAKEDELKALTTKVSDLTAQVEMLTQTVESQKTELTEAIKERDEAREDAKKLGSKKIGLPPPAVLGAPAAPGASTEQGNPVAATKTLTVGQLALAAKTANPSMSDTQAEDLAEQAELLAKYGTLQIAAKGGNPGAARELTTFLNEPAEGCEPCKTNRQHHHLLIRSAIANRQTIMATFNAAGL